MSATRRKRAGLEWVLFAIVLFEASAFALLAFRDFPAKPIDTMALLYGVLVPSAMLLSMAVFSVAFPGLDRVLWTVMHFLFGVGMVMQYRMSPDRALNFAVSYAIGLVGLLIALLVMRRPRAWLKRWVRYCLMGLGVAVLLLSLVFGRAMYGAQNWIRIGGISVQPSEFGKIILCFVLAMSFPGRRTFIKLVPAWVFVGLCVVLLLLQKDLGAALIYFITAVILYFVATTDWIVTGLALLAGSGGAVAAYHLFEHVRVRVAIWKNPWKTIDTTGYQIVQGLMAIGSGGLIGLGLGRGIPSSIPLSYNDFIFAAICEEFGIIMGLAVVLLFGLILLRGARIALDTGESFYAELAFGLTVALGVQTFVIIGGVIRMIPLTGVTLPFVSYGGTSMLVSMIMVGVLEGISVMNHWNARQQAQQPADPYLSQRGGERT